MKWKGVLLPLTRGTHEMEGGLIKPVPEAKLIRKKWDSNFTF